MLSLSQGMASYPVEMNSATWESGDQMAVLNNPMYRNDCCIGAMMPGRTADAKHLDVVIKQLQGLEPVDIGEWVRVVAKM